MTPIPKPERRGPKPRRYIQRKTRVPFRGASARARDEAECDKLMGRIVKAQAARCQYCETTERSSLQWAHGWPRRAYPGVKFEIANTFSLCRRCHKKFTHQPLQWDDFMRREMGAETYARVRQTALLNPKTDFGMLVISLRVVATELRVLTDEQWGAWIAARP